LLKSFAEENNKFAEELMSFDEEIDEEFC